MGLWKVWCAASGYHLAVDYLIVALKPAKLLADSQITLSPAQRGQAEFILGEVTQLGYPTHVAMAAVANALAESNLDPKIKAMEKSGHWSVGLFQLNTSPVGAGAEYAGREDKLTSPKLNLQTLFAKEANMLTEHVVPAGQADVAASRFSEYVERPANGKVRAQQRMTLLQKLFPKYAKLPVAQLPKIQVIPRKLVYIAAAAVIAGIAGFTLSQFSR